MQHDELVNLAERHFSSLCLSQPYSPWPSHSPYYLASLVFWDHIRDDILCRHVVIAVESIGWTFFHARDAAPPSWVMKQVARHCSPFLSSHLSRIISSINLANSFTSFSAPYSDTIYLIVENFMNLDATANFTLKEQTRMSQIAWMSRLNTPSSRVNGE